MRGIKKKVGHNIIANNANWTFQGIEKNFHSIHSIETSGYIPKPSKHAYEKMMLQENIDPLRAIMFEDTKWNLKTAKMLEMTTVLISSKNDLLENEKNDSTN